MSVLPPPARHTLPHSGFAPQTFGVGIDSPHSWYSGLLVLATAGSARARRYSSSTGPPGAGTLDTGPGLSGSSISTPSAALGREARPPVDWLRPSSRGCRASRPGRRTGSPAGRRHDGRSRPTAPRPASSRSAASGGVEVLGLGVVHDQRRRGLLGVSWNSSESSTPIRSGLEQRHERRLVLDVGAGRVAEGVRRAAVALLADEDRPCRRRPRRRSRARCGSARASTRPAPRSAGRTARAARGSRGRRWPRTASRSPATCVPIVTMWKRDDVGLAAVAAAGRSRTGTGAGRGAAAGS